MDETIKIPTFILLISKYFLRLSVLRGNDPFLKKSLVCIFNRTCYRTRMDCTATYGRRCDLWMALRLSRSVLYYVKLIARRRLHALMKIDSTL